MGIAERYEKVEEELAQECALAGRDPKEVRLVAVSKTVGVEGVGEAYAAGARDFGENRPDQIVPKSQAFPDAHWHFIGNIQSRRIRDIVDSASLIHSVYQEKHARKIDVIAREKGIVQDILLEVNIAGQESKAGFTADEAAQLAAKMGDYPGVKLCGLMAIPPVSEHLGDNRIFFRQMRQLFVDIKGKTYDNVAMECLSMGMSDDFADAIAEGSTMVRIGTAIFGKRNYNI